MLDQAHFLKRSLLLIDLMRILYIREVYIHEVRGVLACHLARACDVKCLCFKRFSDFGDIGISAIRGSCIAVVLVSRR